MLHGQRQFAFLEAAMATLYQVPSFKFPTCSQNGYIVPCLSGLASRLKSVSNSERAGPTTRDLAFQNERHLYTVAQTVTLAALVFALLLRGTWLAFLLIDCRFGHTAVPKVTSSIANS